MKNRAGENKRVITFYIGLSPGCKNLLFTSTFGERVFNQINRVRAADLGPLTLPHNRG